MRQAARSHTLSGPGVTSSTRPVTTAPALAVCLTLLSIARHDPSRVQKEWDVTHAFLKIKSSNAAAAAGCHWINICSTAWRLGEPRPAYLSSSTLATVVRAMTRKWAAVPDGEHTRAGHECAVSMAAFSS